MSGCGVDTVSGAPPGGSTPPPPDQGFLIQGLTDPPSATDVAENMIAVFAGATQNLGSVAVASYVTRTDVAATGSTFEFIESGLYWANFFILLPFGGTAGLMCGISLDAPPALRSNQNPDQFFPSIPACDPYFAWPGASVAALTAQGPIWVTPTMASTPGLGVMRCHLSDANNGPITVFDTVIGSASLRVRRLGPAGA